MAVKLNKQESVFRNELIFTADAKAVNLDNTLINLFMLLNHNGTRPKQRVTRGEDSTIDWERLKRIIQALEGEGVFKGFTENMFAAEMWLRSNLVNMVNRGKMDQEKISALRPLHLESYKIRNPKTSRDYYTADQVYLMLCVEPKLKDELRDYLSEGWDKVTSGICVNKVKDVDSLGILHLVRNIKPGFLDSPSSINRVKPILFNQAHVFCEDIKRLLIYRNIIPRNVLIDYLKTIISFHLSIYIQKVIKYLPKMISKGTLDVEDDWNIVVDITESYASKISRIAVEDAEKMYNSIYEYIKATFKINATLRYLNLDQDNSQNILTCLNTLKKKDDNFETYFKFAWQQILSSAEEEDRESLNEMGKYDSSFFDKYVNILVSTRGPYQYKYYIQLLDNLSQKNSDRALLAQGRSRKHTRKFTMGTRLLEAIIQIVVLEVEGKRFITRPLTIDELVKRLRDRYNIIIDGVGEERFRNSDISTNLAFKENITALKNKLRQIGFYNDLSDAFILQKVRPRYEIK